MSDRVEVRKSELVKDPENMARALTNLVEAAEKQGLEVRGGMIILMAETADNRLACVSTANFPLGLPLETSGARMIETALECVQIHLNGNRETMQ